MSEIDRESTSELPKEVVEALLPMSPPPNFAARVMAAKRCEQEPTQSANGWRRRVVLATAVVAVAATALVIWRSTSIFETTTPASSGYHLASSRTTLSLGSRALAVLEPAAELEWTSVSSKTHVVQTSGSVFYRFDKSSDKTTTFIVTTPAGTLEVTGTCFQVEVPLQLKKHVIGAAVGAALVVAVYEGSVLFSADGGANASVPVEAGRELVVSADGRSSVRDRAAATTSAEQSPTLTAPPPKDADREQLLARDSAHRAEIASLRKKVNRLDRAGSNASARRGDDEDEDTPWYNPSKETLVRFAKECRVRYDTPPIMGPTPPQMDANMAAELGLNEVEREGVNQMFRAMHSELRAFIRELYIEVTGDTNAADILSVKAMVSDLLEKSPKDESDRVQQRIANERAGLAEPPTSLKGTSAVERYYRRLAGVGDETEKRLGEILGPERTRRLREDNSGFGSQLEIAGCPGEGNETHEE